MQIALDAFELSMLRVRELHALHSSLVSTLREAAALSDILRSEVVLTVSALDYFVHELTRLGMLECWSGARVQTDAFGRFQIPMSVTTSLFSASTTSAALDAAIRAKHSFASFQHPDRIAEAVRLFSSHALWDRVGQELGRPARDVRGSLVLIVDRRNKIAHEADVDPTYPDQRWPIDAQMVEQMFDDVEQIARAIFNVTQSV